MNNTSDRKLAAIMFADIVSYSRLMGTNETKALKLLKDFEDISYPIVDRFDGSIIKKMEIRYSVNLHRQKML